MIQLNRIEENEITELKATFNIGKIKREFCGMLNKAELGTIVSVYVGINDDGLINKEYKSNDDFNDLDLLITWLNEFEIEVTKEKCEGYDIFKAIANNQIIVLERKVLYRYGSTTKSIEKVGDHPILLKIKKIDITETTNEKANKNSFKKLEFVASNLDGNILDGEIKNRPYN